MNVLHYLNVLIGFSLVMLLLSVVTGFAAQTCLYFFKTKSRTVGKGLVSMLEDIGFDNALATQHVDALLTKSTSISIKKPWGVLNRVIAFLFPRAPRHIGREEFVLLLLRKAASDHELATKLGFVATATDPAKAAAEVLAAAKMKLEKLEGAILAEETKDPTLPAHLWRTKAMQTVVPELASKIFTRFDEVLDRVSERISGIGKVLGIAITLPLLLMYWPVDSFKLLNRLNNDQLLSAQLAGIAETNLSSFQKAHDELQECRKGPNDPAGKDACEQKEQALKKTAHDMMQLDEVKGLFGGEINWKLECINPLTSKPIQSMEQCKRAELTPGIFVTWILVSLGSAFWLGLLNKVLGLRSELSKKLDAQRELRATSQC